MTSLLVQVGTTVGAAVFALGVTELLYFTLLGVVNVVNGRVPIQFASVRRPDPPIFSDERDRKQESPATDGGTSYQLPEGHVT